MNLPAHAEMSRERDRVSRKCTAPVNAQTQSKCKLAESILTLAREGLAGAVTAQTPALGWRPHTIGAKAPRKAAFFSTGLDRRVNFL